MNFDSGLKRLKKVNELVGESEISEKYKSWEKTIDDELRKFLDEWFQLMKFSDNQIKVFIPVFFANLENYSKHELEEILEIIYNSTIQTLILIPKKGKNKLK